MQKLTIITYVLDDDKDDLLLLKPHLEAACGTEFELFTDVDDFIAAVSEGMHIGLIDHQLGAGIDGIEVGRQVLFQNPATHLILFSGSGEKRVWQRATNAGFRRLVDKNDPNCYEQLEGFIRELKPIIQRKVEYISSLEYYYEKYCSKTN